MKNAPAATASAAGRPAASDDPETSVPSRATPSTPPAWRAALTTPEAMPPRSAGAASMTDAVAAGMVRAIPKPAAAIGATSSGYPACGPARARPGSPAPPIVSPASIGTRGPIRAMITPDSVEATTSSAASGSSATPASSAE